MHVCIEDHSRVGCAQIYPDETGATITVFLRAAVAYFRDLGVHVTGVMTDNGGGYGSRGFRQCCARLGLRHLYTRPYTPRTNGKAERFIQTALRERAYSRAYRTSRQRAAHLIASRKMYIGRQSGASARCDAARASLLARVVAASLLVARRRRAPATHGERRRRRCPPTNRTRQPQPRQGFVCIDEPLGAGVVEVRQGALLERLRHVLVAGNRRLSDSRGPARPTTLERLAFKGSKSLGSPKTAA